ncbi:phage virion morphogenesis protein [Hydrocarboniphaga effusa]|uniref:phage virion morphogenesis protein n=1 Tax=Hydrocarboniphaga effusa TaxID=243629 RepID=UPI003BAD51A4
MAGAALRFDIQGLVQTREQLDRLMRFDRRELLQGLAQLGEMQTKRRISDEKEAPDGSAWPAWSDSYAAQRPAGKSPLEDSGGLYESITGEADDSAATWGSNKEYARIHQEGGTTSPHTIRADQAKALNIPGVGYRRSVKHPGSKIPARPYLGISDANRDEIEAEVRAFFEDLLQ